MPSLPAKKDFISGTFIAMRMEPPTGLLGDTAVPHTSTHPLRQRLLGCVAAIAAVALMQVGIVSEASARSSSSPSSSSRSYSAPSRPSSPPSYSAPRAVSPTPSAAPRAVTPPSFGGGSSSTSNSAGLSKPGASAASPAPVAQNSAGLSKPGASAAAPWVSKSEQPKTSGSLWDRNAAPKPATTAPSAAPATAASTVSPGGNASGLAKPGSAAPVAVGTAAAPVAVGTAAATAVGVGAGAATAATTATSANTSAAPAPSAAPVMNSAGLSKPGSATPAAVATAPVPQTPSVGPAAAGQAVTSTPTLNTAGIQKPGAAPTTTVAPAPTAPPVVNAAGLPKPGSAAPVVAGAAAAAVAPAQAAVAKPPAPPQSAMDKAVAKQQSALAMQQLKAEQDKFKKPAPPITPAAVASNPIAQSTASRYVPSTYYDERARWRRDRGRDVEVNVYNVHSYAPSYGVLDGVFLGMMLQHAMQPNYAAFAYHHQSDPGYQAWRADMEAEARQNAEVKAKLAAMDAEIAKLKAQNVPVQANYVPPEVPPSVVLAPAAVVDTTKPKIGERPVIAMGTGGAAGNYFRLCSGGQGAVGLKDRSQDIAFDCRTSTGGSENLDRMASGELDAVLAQANDIDTWMRKHDGQILGSLRATLYQEYVQMLANRQSGVEDVGDLDAKKHTVYLVGGGAGSVWDALVKKNPKRYGDFEHNGKIRRVGNDPAVLDTIAKDPNSVMIFVSGLNSDLLKKADTVYGDKVLMALFKDDSLTSEEDLTGHKIFDTATIPSGIYPKIQQSRWFGLTSRVPTLTVPAVFILSDDWVADNGVESLDKVEKAVWATLPDFEKTVNPK